MATACTPARAPAQNLFADWAVIVVAGDDHAAHAGASTEAFDNARHDIADALLSIGFSKANILQFSVWPEHFSAPRPLMTDMPTITQGLTSLTARARAGCLIYITSHGAPQGVLIRQTLAPPQQLASLIDRTCGDRPTVVVLSACYSGVFVPFLAGQNRLIMSAARRDRTSFGCSEDNKYPYFDDCILQTLPRANDFPALATLARRCIADREQAEGLSPASEPQYFIGATFQLTPYPFFRTPHSTTGAVIHGG